jgi:hypothetical protein
MPSPQRLYEGYTSAELATEFTALKLEMTDGTFTSLGGASKSSTIQRIPLEARLKALRLEMRLLGLQPPRAQKVQSRFLDTHFDEGGTITE